MANMIPISTVTVGSGGAVTISFTNIPQIYTDLKLTFSLRTDSSFGQNWYDTYVTYNNAEASWRDLIGLGSSTNTRSGSTAFVTLGVASSISTSNTFGNAELYIPNYISSNNKSISMDAVSESNATAAATQISAGLYSSSSPISSITITPYNTPTAKFAQYSSATLYGIRKY